MGEVETIDWAARIGAPLDFVDATTGRNALELAREIRGPAVVATVEPLLASRG